MQIIIKDGIFSHEADFSTKVKAGSRPSCQEVFRGFLQLLSSVYDSDRVIESYYTSDPDTMIANGNDVLRKAYRKYGLAVRRHIKTVNNGVLEDLPFDETAEDDIRIGDGSTLEDEDE